MNGKSLFAVSAAGVTLAFGLAACGEDDNGDSASTGTTTTEEQQPAPTGPAAETVNLSETEYKIDPADATAKKAGVVEFKVTNDGSITHALEVEGGDVEQRTDDIAPGETATLKVDLQKGAYELYCPIDDHKGQGMEADLSVAGATGSADDSGSDDDSSSSGSDDDSSSCSGDDSSSGY